ncbi:MAG: hypothetical protein WC501_04910 [Candidatus Micrarchaeia archaeon]
MVSFSEVDEKIKKQMILIWKEMSETDKTHFVNQVAITLSVLGSQNGGRKQVVDVLDYLVSDGAKNLADFGIYLPIGLKELDEKQKRAIRIVENYRMKNNLPNMPAKPII